MTYASNADRTGTRRSHSHRKHALDVRSMSLAVRMLDRKVAMPGAIGDFKRVLTSVPRRRHGRPRFPRQLRFLPVIIAYSVARGIVKRVLQLVLLPRPGALSLRQQQTGQRRVRSHPGVRNDVFPRRSTYRLVQSSRSNTASCVGGPHVVCTLPTVLMRTWYRWAAAIPPAHLANSERDHSNR